MNKEILERRIDMLTLRSQGNKINDIVKDIAQRYNRTESGIWSDWSRRENWVPHILKIGPSTTYEILQGMREALRSAWFTHRTAQQESVKIAALKLIKEIYITIIDIAQSAGLLRREPLEFKEEVMFKIEVVDETAENSNPNMEAPPETERSP